MNQKINRLLLITIFTAIATGFMIFPQIPMFCGFMKLDCSIVPIIIILYILGLKDAFWVLFLRSILKLMINGEISSYIGMPMNVIAVISFILAIWYFQRETAKFTLKKFMLGGIVGTFLLTFVMIILNVIYALPIYEKVMNFKLVNMRMNIKQWILLIILPFNLIQGILWISISVLVLTLLQPIISKQKIKYK
ncbi:MAG: ECF transporter S component [Streptococcaceae bacterium]|jgi:riboflavin transporter FmnP|nr:ECF transporter S component [Streptococcaceae bacterium]